MGQTFKVFDPTTGQYVEKELDGMTPVQEAAQAVQEAAAPVVEAVQQAPGGSGTDDQKPLGGV